MLAEKLIFPPRRNAASENDAGWNGGVSVSVKWRCWGGRIFVCWKGRGGWLFRQGLRMLFLRFRGGAGCGMLSVW